MPQWYLSIRVSGCCSSVSAVGWSLCVSSVQRPAHAGHHLARLPVDPRIGKLLLLAATAGCLAPALSVAAALSYKSPFLGDDAAAQAKRAIAAFGESKVLWA